MKFPLLATAFIVFLTCVFGSLHPIAELYLHTVKMSVSGTLLQTDSLVPGIGGEQQLKRQPYTAAWREEGMDWPAVGLTMVGHQRLHNIRFTLESCLRDEVPGDFVECGVWRGGASIFAKAVLTAHHVSDRNVILVDSFQGLPHASLQQDAHGHAFDRMTFLSVSEDTVKNNFQRYHLLHSNVLMFKGFFNESAPILRSWMLEHKRQIAVLRADGDMYESLSDTLYNLYDLVPVGGFIIIDDWQIPEARRATEDFRSVHGISDDIVRIDAFAVYWRKGKAVTVDMGKYKEIRAATIPRRLLQ